MQPSPMEDMSKKTTSLLSNNKENDGPSSCIRDNQNTIGASQVQMDLFTQPYEIISYIGTRASRKHPRKRRMLQDLTNVAEDLSNHFFDSSTSGGSSKDGNTLNPIVNHFLPPVDQVFKRKSARLKAILNNIENNRQPTNEMMQTSCPNDCNSLKINSILSDTQEGIVTTNNPSNTNMVFIETHLGSSQRSINLHGSVKETSKISYPTRLVEGVNYKDTQFNLDFNEDDYNDGLSSSSDENPVDFEDVGTSTENCVPTCLQIPPPHNTEVEEYLDEGDPIHACKYCGALFWYNERAKKDNKKRIANTFSMCCLQGKVQLPAMKVPPPLLHSLFFDKNTLASKNFHANIRQYNNMFSFTSMGGKIDHSINNGGGPYCFVLSGMNYHSIGSLLPPVGARPVYSQLYVFDTENEVNNRIEAVSKHQKDTTIDPQVVTKIKQLLDEVNPFVKKYRFARSQIMQQHSKELKLCLISIRHHNGRTHNTPTASEVAADK